MKTGYEMWNGIGLHPMELLETSVKKQTAGWPPLKENG